MPFVISKIHIPKKLLDFENGKIQFQVLLSAAKVLHLVKKPRTAMI